jgi:O-antigen/teichoic acid export membrane protein
VTAALRKELEVIVTIGNNTSSHATLNKVSGNAIWSLLRYASSWIALLVVPPLLAHHMPAAAYGVWMLLLQCGSYISFFDNSVQSAISRYVATADGLGDRPYLARVLASAMILLAGAACLALVFVNVAATYFGRIFPYIPSELLPQAQRALLIIGSSLAIALPFTTLVGGFLGLQQNRIVTVSIILSKAVSSVGMIWTGYHNGSIVQLACWFGIGIAVQPVFYITQWFRQREHLPLQPRQANVAFMREFGSFYTLMAINTLASILISGLDLPVAARYDFASVGAYSLASIFANMLLIPQGAILSVAMPAIANITAKAKPEEMGRLLSKLARYSSLSLCGLTVGLVLGAPLFLRLWLGAILMPKVLVFALVLLLAQVLVMAAEPLQVVVLALGRQKNLLPAWTIAAITNLLFSILLARKFGALGVALGTVVGAFAGLAAQFFITMPKTKEVPLARRVYARAVIFEPAIACVPAVVLVVIMRWMHWNLISSAISTLIGVPASMLILWRRTFNEQERLELTTVARRKLRLR